MNPIPEFLFSAPKELGAGIVILNRKGWPPIVGRVIQYQSHLQMISTLNSKPPAAYTTIPGYSIAIIYGGILGKGNVITRGQDMINQAERVMQQMAEYYLTEKILPHKPRFKRYEY